MDRVRKDDTHWESIRSGVETVVTKNWRGHVFRSILVDYAPHEQTRKSGKAHSDDNVTIQLVFLSLLHNTCISWIQSDVVCFIRCTQDIADNWYEQDGPRTYKLSTKLKAI